MSTDRPRTDAGRRIWHEKPVGWTGQEWRAAILAIEAEAAPPPALDVERLAKVLINLYPGNWQRGPLDGNGLMSADYDAKKIAAEYARLSEKEE